LKNLLADPTALGLVMAALFVLYVVVDKVAAPLLKARLANGDHIPSNDDHPDLFRCDAGKFESRISTLEAEMVDTRDDVSQLSGKLDTCVAGLAEISQQTAVIYERVEWMHENRRKRNGDS
jgi:hypothetical protein